jgi:GNAT superfamily N-acetyltransferase
MRSLTLVSANQLSTPQLVEAFNHTFEGYSLPITQTAESLTAMIEADDIQLHASMVALAPDKEYVAIGLLAIRGTRGWVGGMAAAPAWRRQRIGTWLLGRLLAQASALGLATLELEVLEENVAAYRLYQQAGFQDERLLSVFGGRLAPQTLENRNGVPADETTKTFITRVEPLEVLQDFERFHQVRAAWQRQEATLLHLAPHLQGLALCTTAGVEAYMLSSPTEKGHMVMDFGSQSDSHPRRVHHGELLLRHLRGTSLPDPSIQAINVPPGDALGAALTRQGYPVILRQHEMVIRLTG